MQRAVAFIGVIVIVTSVSSPSAQRGVPTPESVIGFAPCSDYKLATYEQVAEYFRRLDAATERMQLIEIGKTAEGRPQLMAIVSSETNMKNLPRLKAISRALALGLEADGQAVDEARAEALAKEGKAVVWVDFGLHATEVAHAQTAPWFAHKVVTEESDEMRTIRDNVVLLLVPNMNPDGGTLVANWYMKHVGTPLSKSEPPQLYHKYVGHDNNRDWFMFNMPESRNVARQLYVEWFPQIIHNQHQTGAFPARITIPPYEDPPNPNIPSLVIRGITEVGAAMARRFEREGKPGVIARIQYDTWWNGGMRSAPYYHNMIGILTEAQHNTADPITYDPKTFPRTFADGTSTSEPSTFYPNPWRGGEWRIRNTCEYMMTASMAVLDLGAKRRQEWLFDIYAMGRTAVREGANESYIVPATQWDAGAATRMINVLRWGGLEVEQARAPFTAGGRTYDAGSFIIRGAQPFRPHLTDMLNPQVYPDRRIYPGGPPERPYDITGWTLSYQMGVAVDRVGEAVQAQADKVEWASPAARVAKGGGAGLALDPRANDSYIVVNRLLSAGETVQRTTAPLSAGGEQWPAGAWIVPNATDQTIARIQEAAKSFTFTAAALDERPSGELLSIRAPRIGLYSAWGGNMDEGWTRWLFEQYEFPYTTVRDKDIQAGDLGSRFDAIVLPDATYASMVNGLAAGTMPDEYIGGMTAIGAVNLLRFVTDGGTLVAMDHASELPLTLFGLPIRTTTAGHDPSEFYIPGALLRVKIDASHPVAHGMPGEAAAFFDESQAFAIGRARSRFEQWTNQTPAAPDGVSVVAEYAPEKDLLMSGWALGRNVVAGRPAVVTAAVGKGQVVLLGFRVQHRAQPHATFKLLFNPLYLSTATGPAGTRPTARQ
jgi:hypothetical protein